MKGIPGNKKVVNGIPYTIGSTQLDSPYHCFYCDYCGTTEDYCNCAKVALKAKQEVFDDLENSELYRQVIQYTGWYPEMKEKHLHPITDKETSNDDSKKVKSV